MQFSSSRSPYLNADPKSQEDNPRSGERGRSQRKVECRQLESFKVFFNTRLTYSMPMISLYLMKTLEKGVFWGYRKRPVAWNGFRKININCRFHCWMQFWHYHLDNHLGLHLGFGVILSIYQSSIFIFNPLVPGLH